MVLRSRLLSALASIEHGFGTRQASLSQEGMVSLEQIHSALPLIADRDAGSIGAGDALLTNRAGARLSIRTADCLPILLAGPAWSAVAALHAGWRGTAGGIVGAALARMSSEFGVDPARVCAAIGPGIGACCYHVGAEVARRFGLAGPGPLDLAEENRRQLMAAGVRAERIEVLGLCTRCDAERFHSWRRDGEAAGRMISYIALRRGAGFSNDLDRRAPAL